LPEPVRRGELAVGAEPGVVDEQINMKIFLADEREDRFRRNGIGQIGDADFCADFMLGREILRQCGEAILATRR